MSIDIQPEIPTPVLRPKTPALASSDSPKRSKTASRWTRLLLLLVVLGALVASTVVVLRAVAPSGSTEMLTHTVARSDLVVSITEEGRLESSSNKEIKCRVKGGSTVLWVIEPGTEVQPGDELVRLDQSTIEDNISQQTIAYQTALATYAQSESDVAVAKISITEYLEGTFRSEQKTAQSNVAIAEENLRVAQNVFDHSQKMFRKGYVSKLTLDSNAYSIEHAKLELEVMETQLEVLEKFTKPKMLEELESALKTAEAKLASDKAALDLEKARLDRGKLQLENCVIRAEVPGMVIYPSAAEWKREPDIEEGAAVREDQVLLIMPDLSEMQVKVGIHEAKIDRVKPGTKARIELQDTRINGEVLTVASIAKPAGWWTGNVVKYDTVITVDSRPDLKPGMSATVELFLAEHSDVLTVPVAAVVEQEDGFYGWVKAGSVTTRRRLELGDSNDQFIVINGGLKEGDEVVLDPLAYIEEAQSDALKPKQEGKEDGESGAADSTTGTAEESRRSKEDSAGKAKESGRPKTKTAITPTTKEAGNKPKQQQAMKAVAKKVLEDGDKNKDGVLTKDEFDEKSKPYFDATDTDGNGKVDVSEIEAGLKRMREAAAEQK